MGFIDNRPYLTFQAKPDIRIQPRHYASIADMENSVLIDQGFRVATDKSDKLKPNMYRVYLNEEATALMTRICEQTEMGQTELLNKALLAALRAIDSNKSRFSLPLKFAVADAAEESDRPEKNRYNRPPPKGVALNEK